MDCMRGDVELKYIPVNSNYEVLLLSIQDNFLFLLVTPIENVKSSISFFIS